MINDGIRFALQTWWYDTFYMMVQWVIVWIPVLIQNMSKEEEKYWCRFHQVFSRHLQLWKLKIKAAYSKKRSMTRRMVPELANSFSATSFPVFRSTAINSTIWNKLQIGQRMKMNSKMASALYLCSGIWMFEVHNEGYQWNKILYQLTNHNLVLEGTAIHNKLIKSKNHNL